MAQAEVPVSNILQEEVSQGELMSSLTTHEYSFQGFNTQIRDASPN